MPVFFRFGSVRNEFKYQKNANFCIPLTRKQRPSVKRKEKRTMVRTFFARTSSILEDKLDIMLPAVVLVYKIVAGEKACIFQHVTGLFQLF
jgi:hypothetical protein